jgi:UDP-N-acetyl-D-glucosamine dehydrogenase
VRVTVVGLGKIGLPLAVQYADAGAQVIGVDIAPAVLAQVADGVPPFPGEPGLAERLAPAVAEGRIRLSTDAADATAGSDVVVVTVPVVVDAQAAPDFRAMDAATAAIGAGLQPGTLVSFETTVPVGTTRGRLAPALAAASGLRPGKDLDVCYSPERVMSGSVFSDLRRYPKLVGGLDARSGQRAVAFYREVLTFDPRPDLASGNGVWDLGSAEAAELTKLAETTYRDVNIALANEFARYADTIGVDVRLVIDAANSQPYSHVHRPGVAVGGHCIPVYPRLYLATDPAATLPAAGRLANEAMPAYACDLLEALLGGLQGQQVVVLGAAYRGGVKETAFSGVFPLVAVLRERGARPLVHDPLFSAAELVGLGFEPYAFGTPCAGAVVQADHDVYRELASAQLPGVRAVVDGRDCLDAARWPGVPVKSLGRPLRIVREN